MLDSFFQKLRTIQKKEINESGLARVGSDFYPKVHSYINRLMDKLESNPFAEEEHRLLKNTQRIATDICSRREHKIADTAVNNIQRSYHLFQSKKPQFDSQDTTPLNLTPEEEQLYFSLMDTVRNHRKRLLPSLDVLDEEDMSQTNNENISKPLTNQYLFQSEETEPVVDIFANEKEESAEVKEVSKHNYSTDYESPVNKSESVGENSYLKEPNVTNTVVKTTKPIDKRSEFKKDIASTKPINSNENTNEVYLSIYADEEFPDLPSEVPIKPNKIPKSRNKEFNPDNISFKTLVVFDEIPPIVGVDEKIYGPFYPQDVVKIPKLNAELFKKHHKGRFIKI